MAAGAASTRIGEGEVSLTEDFCDTAEDCELENWVAADDGEPEEPASPLTPKAKLPRGNEVSSSVSEPSNKAMALCNFFSWFCAFASSSVDSLTELFSSAKLLSASSPPVFS